MILTFLWVLLAHFISRAVAADPVLVHAADVHFDLGETIQSGLTPQGSYVWVPILGGSFNTTSYSPSNSSIGDPLVGRVLPGGSDYALIRTDGSFAIDVSLGIQGLNVPDFFHLTTFGYVQPGLDFSGNRTYEFGELDAWQVFRVNTASSAYGWLNSAALVGQERIILVAGAARAIELKVFRVIVNP